MRWVHVTNRTFKEHKFHTILEIYKNDPKNKKLNAIKSLVLFSITAEIPSPAILPPPGTNHMVMVRGRTPAGIFIEGLQQGG
jgi:hypothetical protein